MAVPSLNPILATTSISAYCNASSSLNPCYRNAVLCLLVRAVDAYMVAVPQHLPANPCLARTAGEPPTPKTLAFLFHVFLYLLTLIINIIYLHCYLIYQYPLPIHDHDLYLFYACAVPLPPVYFFVPFPFMPIYLLRTPISCTTNSFSQVLRLGATSSSPDHSDEPKPLDDHRCDQLQAPPRSQYRGTRVMFFHFDKTSVSHHHAPLSNPDFAYRPWCSNRGTRRPRPPPAFGHTSTHTRD